PHFSQEQLVQPQIAGKLWVKGGCHHVTLTTQDRVVVDPCQHLDVVADPLDVRSPNEHRRDEPHAVHLELGFEGVDLATERIAAHSDVDGAEAALVGAPVEHNASQQNPPRAGPEGGHAFVDTRGDGVEEPAEVEPLRHRRRLAAGHDETVDPAQVLRRADLDGVGAKIRKSLGVLRDVALQGEDPDLHLEDSRLARTTPTSPARRASRRARRSPGPSWPRPGRGSPWPRCGDRGSGRSPRRWPWRALPDPRT